MVISSACFLSAGAQLCACIELSAEGQAEDSAREAQGGGASMASELQAWCRERLPTAAVPGVVGFLPQLPRSSAGKLQRGALPPPDQAPAGTASTGAGPSRADVARVRLPARTPSVLQSCCCLQHSTCWCLKERDKQPML
jgi:hypothetical protein